MVRDALRGYANQVTSLAEDLVTNSRRNRESIALIVRHEVEQAIRRLGVAAAADVDALTQRVRRLERTVRDLEAQLEAASRPSKPSAGTKKATTAKRAPAKTAKRAAKAAS